MFIPNRCTEYSLQNMILVIDSGVCVYVCFVTFPQISNCRLMQNNFNCRQCYHQIMKRGCFTMDRFCHFVTIFAYSFTMTHVHKHIRLPKMLMGEFPEHLSINYFSLFHQHLLLLIIIIYYAVKARSFVGTFEKSERLSLCKQAYKKKYQRAYNSRCHPLRDMEFKLSHFYVLKINAPGIKAYRDFFFIFDII